MLRLDGRRPRLRLAGPVMVLLQLFPQTHPRLPFEQVESRPQDARGALEDGVAFVERGRPSSELTGAERRLLPILWVVDPTETLPQTVELSPKHCTLHARSHTRVCTTLAFPDFGPSVDSRD